MTQPQPIPLDPRTPTLSTDPHAFVTLSRISSLLNEFFDLNDSDRISYDTPFVWWDRSKQNRLAFNMFDPIGYAGANERGPIWHQEQILHWFARWRGINIPAETRQAGDRLSRRGADIPSVWRTA